MQKLVQRCHQTDFLVPLRDVTQKLPMLNFSEAIRVTHFGREYILPELSIQTEGLPEVLLTGGVHGDEPAGGLALVRLYQKGFFHDYAKHFSFTIFPCMNPSGYELAQRCNAAKSDMNRNFKEGTLVRECAEIHARLGRGVSRGRKRFLACADLHECCFTEYWLPKYKPSDFPTGFFLWESCEKTGDRIGPRIVQRVSQTKMVDICTWPDILGDKAVDGVISYPEDAASAEYADSASLDNFLIKEQLSDHAFTFETPAHMPLPNRIAAHMTAVEAMLDNLIGR